MDERLSPGGVQLVRLLGEDLDRLTTRMAARIRRKIPQYAGVADVEANTERHLRTFRKWCVGEDVTDVFELEREISIARIESGFELLPTLEAFRIGEVELWIWLFQPIGESNFTAQVGDALSVFRLWVSFIEQIRGVTLSTFLTHDRRRAAAESSDRRDLLKDMLSGRLSSAEIAERLLILECSIGEEYRVLLIRSKSTTPPLSVVDIHSRLTSRFESVFKGFQGDRPFVTTVRKQLMVLSCSSETSEELMSSIGKSLGSDVEGRIRVGVSLPFSELADFSQAYKQASIALGMTSINKPVCALELVSAFDFVIETADREILKLAAPEIISDLMQSDSYSIELVETVVTYIEVGMSAKMAAERLNVHPNTVYYRLDRLRRISGMDLRSIWDLLDFLIFMRVVQRSAGFG